MQCKEKICLEANNSTLQATPNGAKAVTLHAFNIEKAAKNEAYAFIITHGLFREFQDFCSEERPPFNSILLLLTHNTQRA